MRVECAFSILGCGQTDFAIGAAISQLSQIIDTYVSDAPTLKKIENHKALLEESENSFETGYGGNSVWVEGPGIRKEYMTDEQAHAWVAI
jgi:hypothetical protein